MQKIKTHKQLFIGVIAIALISFMAISCVEKNNKGAQSPPGYNLSQPHKYNMPDILQEISGIAFNKGDSTIVYALQDEEGDVFSIQLGTSDKTVTKFASKGDFEDIAIFHNQVVVLKSNGHLFSFPLSETKKEIASNVVQDENILPKGEYEGMFADESSGLLYVLCKSCKEDKGTKSVSGYMLSIQQDGSLKHTGNFKVDASTIDKLTGKKKGVFHPSGLAINPLTQEWYIISSTNKVLVVADAKWNVKAAYHLSSNIFNQPEGIAFDKQGNLYISNEGSETDYGNILRFNYKKP